MSKTFSLPVLTGLYLTAYQSASGRLGGRSAVTATMLEKIAFQLARNGGAINSASALMVNLTTTDKGKDRKVAAHSPVAVFVAVLESIIDTADGAGARPADSTSQDERSAAAVTYSARMVSAYWLGLAEAKVARVDILREHAQKMADETRDATMTALHGDAAKVEVEVDSASVEAAAQVAEATNAADLAAIHAQRGARRAASAAMAETLAAAVNRGREITAAHAV